MAARAVTSTSNGGPRLCAYVIGVCLRATTPWLVSSALCKRSRSLRVERLWCLREYYGRRTLTREFAHCCAHLPPATRHVGQRVTEGGCAVALVDCSRPCVMWFDAYLPTPSCGKNYSLRQCGGRCHQKASGCCGSPVCKATQSRDVVCDGSRRCRSCRCSPYVAHSSRADVCSMHRCYHRTPAQPVLRRRKHSPRSHTRTRTRESTAKGTSVGLGAPPLRARMALLNRSAPSSSKCCLPMLPSYQSLSQLSPLSTLSKKSR